MTAPPYDFGGTLSKALAMLPPGHSLIALRMQCAHVRPDGTVAEETVNWEIETYGPVVGLSAEDAVPHGKTRHLTSLKRCYWDVFCIDGDLRIGVRSTAW